MPLRERKCTLAGHMPFMDGSPSFPSRAGWALHRAERVPQLRSACPPQVEFTPQTLQQRPPNGWFRLLPFPRAEDSG